MKIIDYTMCVAENLDPLRKKVKQLIDEGYVPQGGVAVVANSKGEWSCVQALVKYDKPKKSSSPKDTALLDFLEPHNAKD